MAEELNPQASSQPAQTGPNAGGKLSDAGSPGMTDSQNRDYTIKTQQLATERKAFESERAKFEQERQGYRQQYQPQQQAQNYGNAYGQQPQRNSPTYESPITQETYSKLVRELGVDAANAHVESLKQAAQSVQSQVAMAQARADRAELTSILTSLDSKGQRLYGDSWKEHGPKVLERVAQRGEDLEYAWFKEVDGGSFDSIRQKAIDQAYQNQQQKQSANVQQQTVQPSGQEPTEFKSVGDAFQAAWKQHAT